jgi:hypothetical protein
MTPAQSPSPRRRYDSHRSNAPDHASHDTARTAQQPGHRPREIPHPPLTHAATPSRHDQRRTPHRRRADPNRRQTRRALARPTPTPGALNPAGLRLCTTPSRKNSEAKPASQGRPDRAEHSEPRRGALYLPAKRNYHSRPSVVRSSTPHILTVSAYTLSNIARQYCGDLADLELKRGIDGFAGKSGIAEGRSDLGKSGIRWLLARQQDTWTYSPGIVRIPTQRPRPQRDPRRGAHTFRRAKRSVTRDRYPRSPPPRSRTQDTQTGRHAWVRCWHAAGSRSGARRGPLPHLCRWSRWSIVVC